MAFQELVNVPIRNIDTVIDIVSKGDGNHDYDQVAASGYPDSQLFTVEDFCDAPLGLLEGGLETAHVGLGLFLSGAHGCRSLRASAAPS
jgi:hypothetical protein